MAGFPGTPATAFTFPARNGPIIRHFMSEYSDGGISCALAALLVQQIVRMACARKKAAPFERTVFTQIPPTPNPSTIGKHSNPRNAHQPLVRCYERQIIHLADTLETT